MTNRVEEANDALWEVVSTTFASADAIERNPKKQLPPKPKGGDGVALYVEQQDDITPHTVDVLCGPIFDLALEPRVLIVCLGPEERRRAALVAAVEALKAALAQDPRLGGAVDYARLKAPDDAAATGGLEWMAGGRSIPVYLLFSAPSEAG